MLSAEGMAAINMSSLISMNDTAAFLWKNVQGKDFTVEDLTKLLLDEYEVEESVAAKDCQNLIDEWKKLNLLED